MRKSTTRAELQIADRVARALNLLGANGDLLNRDSDALLELIDEYLADDDEHEDDDQGKCSPTL